MDRNIEHPILDTNMPNGLEHLTPSDLWIPGHRKWDIELLEEIFTPRDVQEIASIPIGMSTLPDDIIWPHAKHG